MLCTLRIYGHGQFEFPVSELLSAWRGNQGTVMFAGKPTFFMCAPAHANWWSAWTNLPCLLHRASFTPVCVNVGWLDIHCLYCWTVTKKDVAHKVCILFFCPGFLLLCFSYFLLYVFMLLLDFAIFCYAFTMFCYVVLCSCFFFLCFAMFAYLSQKVPGRYPVAS